MRDLSNQEKHDNARLTKQIEKQLSELTGLKKDKEKQQNEIVELQNQTIELKEQVSIYDPFFLSFYINLS